ncbi:carbamoyl-phosphate synthase large subunit, partial [Glaesserella parasuis]|nr:carbamoyl-phosphate synthase large subunit [Glaesserella parasuis]
LETGFCGFDLLSVESEKIRRELANPGPNRILYVADAFGAGFSLDEVHHYSKIDPWFLIQIQDLVQEELALEKKQLSDLDREELRRLKRKGFSDKRIAQLTKVSEKAVRDYRHTLGILPVYKRVDTCAAEFASDTAYLYSTYEEECEANPSDRKKVMILGGGPNRIGQGIEFDYCCVHASLALREAGYETIMVNCNPETVSTDFDTSDRLYFEPLTLEDVLEVVRVEQPWGVIVHYGGQTPLKLANALHENGVNIIGTSADSIDAAEDRERFQKILHDLNLKQPANRTARNAQEAVALANEVGYPLVVRPSYVLGGRAMQIVYNDEELNKYMREAVSVSNDSPILLDHFLNNAIEVDVDCICDGENVVIGGIMQHVEQAGIHSGDSACSLPAYSLSGEILDEIRRQTKEMAFALGVKGLMNVQFAAQNDVVYVLEVNPRASRTVPFVSKATGQPLAKIAARVMAGESLAELNALEEVIPQKYFVKEAVFPFIKFPGVDTILGPEMRSTGEVMGVGETFAEAFFKAQLGAGERIPRTGKVFLSVDNNDKPRLLDVAKRLQEQGYGLCATLGTAKFLRENGIATQIVNKVREGRPHIVDAIKNGEIAMVINTVNGEPEVITDSHSIRRTALQQRVPVYTTIAGADAISYAVEHINEFGVYSVQELHSN